MFLPGRGKSEKMKIGTFPEFLLDTNTVLEAFWGVEPVASTVKTWIREGKIAISAISVAEILSRATAKEKEKLNLLTSRFRPLAVDHITAEIAGNYRQKFLRKKKKVFLLDCLVAATAKLYNLKIVTRNIKDYPMKDIEIIDSSTL